MNLIVVIYDSITNSIFHGQVLQPLLDRLAHEQQLQITLVSFETTSSQQLLHHIPSHPRLQIIIGKKLPFIGTISLRYAARQLSRILATHSAYELLARGPLAGFICLKAADKRCAALTVQARGLLAQEYAYAHRDEKNWFKKLVHRLRGWQFWRVEKEVYMTASLSTNCRRQLVTIQSVSPALKNYLITEFGADPTIITIAQHDLPPQLPDTQLRAWRTQIRNELNIAHDTVVYCYNGSAKPWQCPEKAIGFFKILPTQAQNFLLVLTADTQQFQQLAADAHLNPDSYAIMQVAHKDIYKYLAACDYGLIFRDTHILNAISRPTKILEYHAARMTVIHNDTIAWLAEQPEIRQQSVMR